MTDLLDQDIQSGARFSTCRSWRYLLWRTWDNGAPPLVAVLLNPSTADETEDDPTVTRMMRRASSWGYGGLVVANAYAYRATKPADLWRASDPVGPENDAAIREACASAGLVICGWGRHCRYSRSRTILGLIRAAGQEPHALRLLADGTPGHPLYVPYSAQPVPVPASGEVG